jgi:hypothetical protein
MFELSFDGILASRLALIFAADERVAKDHVKSKNPHLDRWRWHITLSPVAV